MPCPCVGAWPAVPVLLVVMGLKKRVQDDSGACCGVGRWGYYIRRTSFVCKLSLEMEAQEHSKSGIPWGLLSPFLPSLPLFLGIH